MAENIRVRPLQPGDHQAIADIAVTTPGFTVPAKYMVGMLATTHGELCRVTIDQHNVVIGYTLGMQTTQPEVGFSWRTAVLPDSRSQHVAAALVAQIAKAGKASGISLVRFTYTVEQAAIMAKLISASGIGEIEATIPITSEWRIDEVEVHLRLGTVFLYEFASHRMAASFTKQRYDSTSLSYLVAIRLDSFNQPIVHSTMLRFL